MTGVSKAWVWAREGGGKIIKVDRSCVRPAGSLKRAAAAAALAGPYRSADDIRDISEIGEIVGTREQVRRCQTSGGLRP